MRSPILVLLTVLPFALPITAHAQRGAPEDVLLRATAGFPMSLTAVQVEASCTRRHMEIRSGTSGGFDVRLCESTEHDHHVIRRYEFVHRGDQLMLSKFLLAEAAYTLEDAIARLTTFYRALRARYGGYQQATGGDCIPNEPTDIAGCVATEEATRTGQRSYGYSWEFEPPFNATLALELDQLRRIRLGITETERGWDVVVSWESPRISEAAAH